MEHVGSDQTALIAALQDIFVAVALLTISVGLILPGMIAHAAEAVASAADRLATGTLADFSRAMQALGAGRLEEAYAKSETIPVVVYSQDELHDMAVSFNRMQDEIEVAAVGLDLARDGIRDARWRSPPRMQNPESRIIELHDSRERYEIAVNGSKDGLWDFNLPANQVYFSVRWKDILGYTDHEIENSIDSWFSRIHPEDTEWVNWTWNRYLSGEIPSYEIEFRMQHKNGGHRWILARGVALRDPSGTAYRVAGSHSDITERKKLEEEREHLLEEALRRAERDPLTDLLNYQSFHKRLRYEMTTADKRGTTVGMTVVDLDNFKFFNDAYGHAAGDEVLRKVAKTLEGVLGPIDTLARYGGDEFSFILPGCSRERLEGLTDQLNVEVNKIGYHPPGYDMNIPLSLSVGCALYPREPGARAIFDWLTNACVVSNQGRRKLTPMFGPCARIWIVQWQGFPCSTPW